MNAIIVVTEKNIVKISENQITTNQRMHFGVITKVQSNNFLRYLFAAINNRKDRSMYSIRTRLGAI